MPSSYVPGITSRLTDNMTFIQRLENWLLYTVNDVIYSYYIFPEWDEYYSKVLGKRNVYTVIILIYYEKCSYLSDCMKTHKRYFR